MGLFIVFEGVEGSGKSTQARGLARRLTAAGYPARLVHEPGGTPTGDLIRRWTKRRADLTPVAELLLFLAARAQLVESVIRPALGRSEAVVCDRYTYSTVAYQGYGRGLGLDIIASLNELATGGLHPQLVVLLDLPPELGLARKPGGPRDRFEEEQLDFHRRVQRGYLAQAQQEPARWLVLDSSKPRPSVAAAVWHRVSQMLETEGARGNYS